MTDIQLRPADSSWRDAEAFAQFANMAEHNLYMFMLGKRWQQILARVAQHPDHELSMHHAYFIEAQDGIGGMMSGYTGKQTAQFGSRSAWLVLRYGGYRLPQALYFVYKAWPAWSQEDDSPNDHTFYIQYLALSPTFRGLGLAQRLLQKAEDLAREQGCTALALNVLIDNQRAISVYQLFGFEIVASPTSVKVDGQELAEHRMVKRLV
ncbi:MAG: hypothetical protein OHK0046_35410 [Anaerolineae bacterium]